MQNKDKEFGFSRLSVLERRARIIDLINDQDVLAHQAGHLQR